MATTADIKNGLCIEMNNDLFTVVEFLHVKPWKRNSFCTRKNEELKRWFSFDTNYQNS